MVKKAEVILDQIPLQVIHFERGYFNTQIEKDSIACKTLLNFLAANSLLDSYEYIFPNPKSHSGITIPGNINQEPNKLDFIFVSKDLESCLDSAKLPSGYLLTQTTSSY